MRYLFLAYRKEKPLNALSGSEVAALEECAASNDALRRSGHLLAAQAFPDSGTAATVRVQNGRAAITEGPYARTSEQLAGLYLIDAVDLNEAIRVASRMPQALLGPIEVRPVEEVDPAAASGLVDGGQWTVNGQIEASQAAATGARAW